MIPTTCPYRKDPRLCAYCDKKDTCDCRCDKNTDVIWGEITGELKDQTDLQAALDKHTSSETAGLKNRIEALNVQAHVDLMCRGKKLYIVCDKGYIKNDDSVVLFRYVRSSNRYTTKNGHYKKTIIGWKEPHFGRQENIIRLHLEQDTTTNLRYQKDVWQIVGSVDNASCDIIRLFQIYDTSLDDNKNNRFYPFNKKCGIRVKRGDEWVTDYLPFMARKLRKPNKDGYNYGVGRWAEGWK